MKARNPSTGTLETVYVKALDSMPVGTIVDYDGQASDIPTGWETYGTGQIKKTSEARPLTGHIVNTYSESQENAYSCNYVNGIIESGSNANGNYVKYADGTMICYRTATATLNCTTAWNTLYIGDDRTTVWNFAQTFINTPVVNLRLETATGASFIQGSYYPLNVTTTGLSGISIIRPDSRANIDVILNIIAIGKWK